MAVEPRTLSHAIHCPLNTGHFCTCLMLEWVLLANQITPRVPEGGYILMLILCDVITAVPRADVIH